MSLQLSQWLSLIILLRTHFSLQDAMTSTTVPTINQTQKISGFNNISEQERNVSSSEEDWRVNNSFDRFHSTNRINNVDFATIHKFRRNGFGNSPDTTTDNFKRNFHLPVFPNPPPLPQGNEFQSNFHLDQHPPENYRFNDEIYPVRKENCVQYSRDVNHFQNYDHGIIQGWIGGKSRWQDKHNNDENPESTVPKFVPITTATAKVPPSFNRYQESHMDKNNHNYNKGAYVPVKSRLYDSEYRVQNSREYSTDGRNTGRGYDNHGNLPWPLPTYRDRNNRIIYYEYNFDDLRRPKPGDPPSQYPREHERNCGFFDSEFSPCDPNDVRFHTNKPPVRNPFTGPYNRGYSGSHPSAQSKSWPSISNSEEVNSEFQNPVNLREEAHHRFRNTDRGQQRKNANRYKGFVYSLDLPSDGRYMAETSSPIYVPRFPIEHDQFLNDDNRYESSSKSTQFLPVNHRT